MRIASVLVLVALAGCPGKKQEEPPAEPPPPGTLVRGDAGITEEVTTLAPGNMHMDDGVTAPQVQSQAQPQRPGRPIDVTLRSTPPGAQVAVDGAVLGVTPQYWNGMADGHEHEFVFTMRGYAIARYRFVPVTSGVIHGRLDLIHEETDAGVPTPPPEVVPPRPPHQSTINPPSAPPTLTTDAGAAPPGPVGPTPGGAGEAVVGPQP